jgi:hypothetical protein
MNLTDKIAIQPKVPIAIGGSWWTENPPEGFTQVATSLFEHRRTTSPSGKPKRCATEAEAHR